MKPTPTPSIERLQEALRPFARVQDAVDRPDSETVKVTRAVQSDENIERGRKGRKLLPDGSVHVLSIDGLSLGDFRRAREALLATLETLTPSAGEGERLFREQTRLVKKLCDIIDCEAEDVGHGLGSSMDCLRELGPVNDKAISTLALTPPLEQPDLEGRARLRGEIALQVRLAMQDEMLADPAIRVTMRTDRAARAANAILALSLPTTEIRLK